MATLGSPLSPEAIQSAVASLLNQDVSIPAGHRGALVTVVNLDRVDVALATKINDHWSAEVIGSHEWTGNNQLGVMSKLTW